MKRPAVVILVVTALYLWLNLFVLPLTPILLNGDQVYFWTYGQRMLQGERVYLDFFQYLPPGTDLVFFAAFKTLGSHVWVTNVVVLVLGVVLSLICFSIASQLTSRRLASLIAILFTVLIYGRLLNATHHWFSVLLVMLAVGTVIQARSIARIAVAGALLGLAAFFTQTHGIAALSALVLFLIWERFVTRTRWRSLLAQEAAVLLAFVTVLAVVDAHYVAAVGLRELWYLQFTYVRKFMVQAIGTPWLGLPEPPTWRRLPVVAPYLFVYALLAVTYPLTLLAWWRDRGRSKKPRDDHRVVLLALTGTFLLAEVLVSPNWLRLYTVSMPATILFVWLATRGRRARYAIASLWAVTAVLAVGQTWSRHSQNSTIGELRGEPVATSAQAYSKLRWINDHTAANELFLQAAWPGMYIPLRLRNPIFLDALSTVQRARPEDLERSVRELDAKQVRYVLWSPRLNQPDPHYAWAYQLSPVRVLLREKYERVRTFPDEDEVWKRK